MGRSYNSILAENEEILRSGFYAKNGKIKIFPRDYKAILWTPSSLSAIAKEQVVNIEAPKVCCTNEGSIDYVLRKKAEGCNMLEVGILNFMNASPNGLQHSLEKDSQEGDIGRCSDLATCSYSVGSDFYTEKCKLFDTLEVGNLLSFRMTVFRNSAYSLLSEPVSVWCVSVAPYNWVEQEKSMGSESQKLISRSILKERMFNALCVLRHLGCKYVGLGALGCGEDGVHPTNVAYAWSELLSFMGKGFKEVTMPVPSSKNLANYRIFDKEFNK